MTLDVAVMVVSYCARFRVPCAAPEHKRKRTRKRKLAQHLDACGCAVAAVWLRLKPGLCVVRGGNVPVPGPGNDPL